MVTASAAALSVNDATKTLANFSMAVSDLFDGARPRSKKRSGRPRQQAERRVDERRSRSIPAPRSNYSFHPEQLVDAPGVDAERLVRLDVERARMRQVDLEVVGHPCRSGG